MSLSAGAASSIHTYIHTYFRVKITIHFNRLEEKWRLMNAGGYQKFCQTGEILVSLFAGAASTIHTYFRLQITIHFNRLEENW